MQGCAMDCEVCGWSFGELSLDLGHHPLCDDLVPINSSNTASKFHQLVSLCENCLTAHQMVPVEKELLFKPSYHYRASLTKDVLDGMLSLVQSLKAELQPTEQPLKVLDIGCNDGSQLNAFQDIGSETYGVDPAENLYPTSSQRHNVSCGFFTGKEFAREKFDVITCQNAFAHNFNQLELLQNIKTVMHKDSMLFATTSQCDMILNGEFDTIYHEHLSFYNIKSIDALCKRAGLNLIDVIKNPIHGMSYIFIISKFKTAQRTIDNLIELETIKGLYDEKTYNLYEAQCLNNVTRFANFIKKLREDGKTIIGFGAPAKGNTLMNFAGIGPDFIIDENPLKQGLFCPGINVPIYGSSYLDNYKDKTGLVFIPLAWNFYKEIKSKILKMRPNGADTFVRHFPKFEVEV